jgi:mannose-1-phosphate guanylyltransferase/mannose-6-phosphate isomerase
MPSPTADLLAQLLASGRTDHRPWGFMRCFDDPHHDLTIKYLTVQEGHRTSMQRHDRKDELLIILSGGGNVEAGEVTLGGDGAMVRIRPGVAHQVVGPLVYLEVSTYDDDTDTTRLEDDYGRT